MRACRLPLPQPRHHLRADELQLLQQDLARRPHRLADHDLLETRERLLQLEQAVDHHLRTGLRLGDALLQLSFLTEEELREALCRQLDVTFVDLDRLLVDRQLAPLVPKEYAQHHRVVPVASAEGTLTVAVAAKDAVHFIGMPEGNTALAQGAIYLATAPKSNAVYEAYNHAAADAHNDIAQPVPLHLRNAPTKLMKDLQYGAGYRYAHDEADAVADMSCLPEALLDRKYYHPNERGFEKEIKRRLDGWEALKKRRRTSE